MGGKSIVVAGFPGVGKSALTAKIGVLKDVEFIDSDSSLYSWYPNAQHPNRVRHPDFPNNYVKHVKDFITRPNYVIFVSTHSTVLDALEKAKIPVTLVYPEQKVQISEYTERYRKRGSSEEFIQNIKTNWGAFITSLQKRTSHLFTHYQLEEGEYLSDVIESIYLEDK